MCGLIYRDLSFSRRFGVEFELLNNLSKSELGNLVKEYEFLYGFKHPVKVTPGFQGWAQTKSNSYWHVKFDRTCGWEIASYIGVGTNDIDHISRLARFLYNNDAKVDSNCGFHIHVEVNDFSTSDMEKLIFCWMKVEHLLIAICDPSRKNNQYCKSLRDVYDEMGLTYSDPIELWKNIAPKNLDVHENYSKRVSLNTVGFLSYQKSPSFSQPTVELRLPECLLSEIHVRNWINLILIMVQSIKCNSDFLFNFDNIDPCNDLKEALAYLGLSEKYRFVVLDHDLMNTKIWFLNKIINSSLDSSVIENAKKIVDYATSI